MHSHHAIRPQRRLGVASKNLTVEIEGKNRCRTLFDILPFLIQDGDEATLTQGYSANAYTGVVSQLCLHQASISCVWVNEDLPVAYIGPFCQFLRKEWCCTKQNCERGREKTV